MKAVQHHPKSGPHSKAYLESTTGGFVQPVLEQCPEEGGRRGMSIQGPDTSEHNAPLLPISTYI